MKRPFPKLKRRKAFLSIVLKKHKCKLFLEALANNVIKADEHGNYVSRYYLDSTYFEYDSNISDWDATISYCPFCGNKLQVLKRNVIA